MGTRRTEAFLQCSQRRLETSDHVLMLTICHKWNDHQVRPLEMNFNDLLGYMPYRHKKFPHRMLLRSLQRIADGGIICLEHNGRRYLSDRWLRIEIVCPEFRHNFDAQQRRKKASVQPQSLESRASSARPATARAERAGPVPERAVPGPARGQRAPTAPERASQGGHKDRKDHSDQDRGKAAQLRGPEQLDLLAIASDGPPAGAAAPGTPGGDAWQGLLAELQLIMPAAAYHTWVYGQTRYLADEDGEFIVQVANAYVRDWLHSRLRAQMTQILSRLSGRTTAIRFVCPEHQWPVASDQWSEERAERAEERERQLPFPRRDAKKREERQLPTPFVHGPEGVEVFRAPSRPFADKGVDVAVTDH